MGSVKHGRLCRIVSILLIALSLFLLTGVGSAARQRALSERLIRLHVIAASDRPEDQAVKLLVRDGLLERLSPALEDVSDAGTAGETLRALLPELARTAAELSGGEACASLGRELYPTRRYDGFALPAGEYTSLRVVLGPGEGRNWWCVVYPPLCAAGTETTREISALSADDLGLVREDGKDYEIRFRLIEWWEELFGAPKEEE